MIVPGYRDHPTEPWDPVRAGRSGRGRGLPAAVLPGEPAARARSSPGWPSCGRRSRPPARYVHTPDELAYGAKMAWRNASRCIGRLYWRSLVVLDRRRARTADEIFSLLVHHLQTANGAQQRGAIRPVISIFAPAAARASRSPGSGTSS